MLPDRIGAREKRPSATKPKTSPARKGDISRTNSIFLGAAFRVNCRFFARSKINGDRVWERVGGGHTADLEKDCAFCKAPYFAIRFGASLAAPPLKQAKEKRLPGRRFDCLVNV